MSAYASKIEYVVFVCSSIDTEQEWFVCYYVLQAYLFCQEPIDVMQKNEYLQVYLRGVQSVKDKWWKNPTASHNFENLSVEHVVLKTTAYIVHVHQA